jgi:carboxyl-terminal processing protease
MKVSLHLMRKIFLVLFFIGSFLSGLVFSDKFSAYAAERYQDLQIFTKVLNLVQQYYVEEVDTRKLIYGGIKGMLQELDPHTNFLPPELFKEFENETSGEFGGLGIEITVQGDILTVISPIEDTPAWEAGIQAGDKIVEINGESTKGLSLAEAAQKMRGKKGSKVRMGIFREGFDKPKEFAITRGVVKVKSVKMLDLEDGIGYIRLTSFVENSATEMEKAIRQLESTHKEIKGLIIDLRRNPGGLLDQAVKISDMFLESGVIVSTIGRNKKEKEVISAKKDGTLPNFPLIVLINEYSASASEIFAGAMQDNKRAVVMGQPSFGKGSVQSVVKLGDGSGLKLTVARYYTPSGKSIQAEGIKPDVIVEDVDAEAYKKAVIKRDVRREQDMSGHLLGDKEKKDRKDKSVDKQAADDGGFWYKQTEAKKGNLKPREKILSEDFQVQQAYNYLRVWKTMEKIGSKSDLPASEQLKSDPPQPPQDPSPEEKPDKVDKPKASKKSGDASALKKGEAKPKAPAPIKKVEPLIPKDKAS